MIDDRPPNRTGSALRTTFALATPALRAASAAVWRTSGLRRRYPDYLRAMHGIVRASVPLMELAARRCAALASSDPVAQPLHAYLDRHIDEERGHDEWLLADLATLGFDPADMVAEPPPTAVARLVGPQYYWIEHHHPVALLGYIAMLESNAPSSHVADWIVSATGVPAASVRTIREHADLDGGHSEAVFDLLDVLPLTAAQAKCVTVAGLHTAESLMGLFAHIVRASDRPGRSHLR